MVAGDLSRIGLYKKFSFSSNDVQRLQKFVLYGIQMNLRSM